MLWRSGGGHTLRVTQIITLGGSGLFRTQAALHPVCDIFVDSAATCGPAVAPNTSCSATVFVPAPVAAAMDAVCALAASNLWYTVGEINKTSLLTPVLLSRGAFELQITLLFERTRASAERVRGPACER